jgi:hypothetical protein
MYLRRRVEQLLEDVATGQLKIPPDAEAWQHIKAVVRHQDGSADLSSCSPHLRSYARAYFGARQGFDSAAPERPRKALAPSEADTAKLNRELFVRLEEVFFRLCGYSTAKMMKASPRFRTAYLKKRAGVVKWTKSFGDFRQEVEDVLDSLRAYLGSTNVQRWQGAAALPGLKLVCGGKQSFTASEERAARSMLLYCDTVLIPDPVLPFIETLMVGEPPERNYLPRLLEQIFYLQKLRPLVEAELPFPAIAVFPSFEKSLEQKDPVTQDSLEQQLLGLFSHFIGIGFEDFEELDDLRRKDPARLVSAIASNRLLLATGQEEFEGAATWIRQNYGERLSDEMRSRMDSLDDLQLAVQYIQDQLVPQHHLKENAESLNASPLIAADTQWHYFLILRQVEREILVRYGIVRPETVELIEALNTPSLRWLGNVPIDALVDLRLGLQNDSFRKKLHDQMDELGRADGENLDAVTAKVSRAIGKMIAEHESDAKAIAEKYRTKHAQTVVATWMTAGASFAAILPLTVAAALGVASKYGADKVGEILDLRANRKALFGVLAAASKKAD